MPGAAVGSAVERRSSCRTARPDDAGPRLDQGPVEPLARWLDALPDAVIVVLATWTLVYHVSFVLRVGSTSALAVEALLLAAGLGVRVATRGQRHGDRLGDRIGKPGGPGGPGGPASDDQPAAHTDTGDTRITPVTAVTAVTAVTWLRVLVLAAAVTAAAAMALRLSWTLVWLPWVIAAAAGLALALGPIGQPGRPVSAHPTRRREALAVLLLASAAAGLSLVVLRPNPDDLFYVNLSQWVAQHGSFPHRDTIYADLVYPMSNWPPLASYDAGTGALAHLLDIRAATVDYVVVPPIASAVSVLVLWRLLRSWRVQHALVALGAAVVFLMVDGTASYGPPGNLWVTRLWQGKVVLLCVVVPWLLRAALHYVRSPGRRPALWLLLGGIAGVGCSTTAVFLVPVVAVAGAAPLLRRDPRRALVGCAAMAAYPLAMAVLTVVVGGRSADEFGSRRAYRFEPSFIGHLVFLDGVVAAVGVAAVLLGCLLVPDPAARATSATAALLTGLVFVPGVTRVGYDLVGLGPTLWRLTWCLTVAALVGAAASWVASRLRRRLAWTAGTVAAVVLVVLGHPILAADTTTTFSAPLHWQRTADSRAAAAWAIADTGPGARILGPDGLAITVAVTTTAVKTVTPRDYYLDYLRDTPGFDFDQRLELTDFINGRPGWTPQQIGPALRGLDVGVACAQRQGGQVRVLRRAGYRPAYRNGTYRCLVAAPGRAAPEN